MTTDQKNTKSFRTTFKVFFSVVLVIIIQNHLHAQVKVINAPARKTTISQNPNPVLQAPQTPTKQKQLVATENIKRLNTSSFSALKNDFTALRQGDYSIISLQLPGSDKVSDYYVKKWGSRLILNGDIIVADLALQSTMSYSKNDNNFLPSKHNLYRWPGGDVPVVLDESVFETDSYNTIKSAFDFFNFNTGIVFKERTNEEDYVYITVEKNKSGRGGASPVGRQIGGSNILPLTEGGFDKSTVLHELMHALGFYHEQSRIDRDSYININWGNINESAKHDFQIELDGTVRSSYDYCSIMQYPSMNSFGIIKNVPTITCKITPCPSCGTVTPCPSCMGDQTTLSKMDIEGLEKLYGEIGVSRFPSRMPFTYSKIPIAGCIGVDDNLIKAKWEYYKDALGDCQTGVIGMGILNSKYVQFQRGIIYHTPRGIFVIYGYIYELYNNKPTVRLGLPLSDEEDINDESKGLLSSWKINGYTRISKFESGVIVWGPKKNALALTNEKFGEGPVKAPPVSEKASPTPIPQQSNSKITKSNKSLILKKQ